ncbi:MAG TPA: PIG-L family deacetylase [Mycobacteriales bacterium]|nr:PIG-L family deacetylase [Mycobacteriales bacterium]
MPSTIVYFHAHPDDESISTAGVMRKAAEAGHRTVLVIATDGGLGEEPDGLLQPGETLVQRRAAETAASAEVLGVARVEFLGYADSGMAGEPTNQAPNAFAAAPVDEAAQRLAAILQEENAGVLTCYDSYGGYGHPDHIQVHHVGLRAAELAGTPRVYQATMSRDRLAEQIRNQPDAGLPAEAATTWGTPEAEITAAVDVTPWQKFKRESMRVHASQIYPDSPFLGIDDEAFAYAFGTEWFIGPEGAPDS